MGVQKMTSTELKHRAKLQTWSAAIQECRSSGLSVKQWCKQRAVTPTTYYRWERELLALAKTEKNTMRETVAFVELPAPKHEMQNVSERVAAIRINDASVDLYAGMQPELLKALIETLRSC